MRPAARGEAAGAHEPTGFFVLRSAALPFETLARSDDALQRLRRGDEGFAEVRGRLRAELQGLVAEPLVREAIALASPSLAQALGGWSAEQSGEGADKLARSAFRYASRMSARATPFGLFAAISVGVVGASTGVHLAELSLARRRVQLDAPTCLRLSRRWSEAPSLRRALRFFPAPQMAALGGWVRCVPMPFEPDDGLGLVELRRTPALEALLEASEAGLRIDELVERLGVVQPRASEAARQGYVQGLIEAGVLLSELTLAATGAPPLRQLRDHAQRLDGLAALRPALERLQRELDTLEAEPLGAPPQRYEAAAALLAQPPLAVEAPQPVQVELGRPLRQATLGPAVVGELLATARWLAGLPRPLLPRLDGFIERFRERYDTRFVPLMEAIDDDHGVGFSKGSFQESLPLLDGLALGTQESGPSPWTAPERALLPRLLDASASGAREILLGEGEVGGAADGPLPASFVVLAALSAASDEAVDRGEFTLLEPRLLAPSGVGLLGRFCGIVPELEPWLRRHLEREAQGHPDAILADLVDLPCDRAANIVLRPVLRSHEIVLQGGSGAPPPQRIGLRELLVGVERGRVVLYSERLGRRILVRGTTALDTTHPLTTPAHHFLGELERQDRPSRALSWGALEAAFLPRLRYRKAVLLPAQWALDQEALGPLLRARGEAQYDALQRSRERLRLPRWVSFGDGDHRLPLDLDNPLAVEALAHEARGQRRVVLKEFLPALMPRAVRGPEGSFVHELLVPFGASPPREASPPVPLRRARTPGEARVPPGRGVLYAKIYGAPAAIEQLLLGTLAPRLRRPASGEGEPAWFFLRYDDPQHHLRLRVLGAALAEPLAQELIGLVADAVERGLIARMQIDTYEREVERYGGPLGMELSEQIFCADSVCCAALLALATTAQARWQLAALGADALLDDFGLSLPEKLELTAHTARRFVEEFGGDLLRGLGEQFRRQRGALDEALRAEGEPWRTARSKALEPRRDRVRPLVERLRRAEHEGELGQPLRALLKSHLHLFCNRLFDHAPRLQEMALHSLLERHYRAQLARHQGGKS